MTEKQANLDLVADYLGEAHDYLDQLNRLLLAMPGGGAAWPPDQVNELFRSAHSLKGLSACFGFEKTNSVTHELESLMTLVQNGKLRPSQEVVRRMFAAIDAVTHLTAEIAGSGGERAEIALVVDLLQQVAADPSSASVAEPPEKAVGPSEPVVDGPAKGGAADGKETVRVRMDRLDRMVNLTGELVITRSRFQLVARQMRPLQHLGELAAASDELQQGLVELEDLAASGEVTVESVQRIVDRMRGHADHLRQGMTECTSAGRSLRELDQAAYDLDGVVGGIHEAVLQLRLVPLDTVFRRLQRVVRDTAELLGKPIEFEVVGGDAQIDKRVADELVNPLVHMLRNAVDHGIESPAARRDSGKPRAGSIRVRSFQRGSSVVIEVRDDGGGIDPARLLAKAVEKGILRSEEAASMPSSEAQRLIFAPGFSTAAKVTEVSGRGMGMDIVLASIKKLRGSLDLASEVGKGTTFTIELPPSMSILLGLLIEVRGTMFALPLTEVREIVELGRLRTHRVQGRPTIVVRDQPMPLVALPDTYRFASAASAPDASVSPPHAIVFGGGPTQVALAVDRLIGKEDLVIKPLCAELAGVPGLAGMAIRGDGRVTLILDPTSFAEHALGRRPRVRSEELEPCPEA